MYNNSWHQYAFYAEAHERDAQESSQPERRSTVYNIATVVAGAVFFVLFVGVPAFGIVWLYLALGVLGRTILASIALFVVLVVSWLYAIDEDIRWLQFVAGIPVIVVMAAAVLAMIILVILIIVVVAFLVFRLIYVSVT